MSEFTCEVRDRQDSTFRPSGLRLMVKRFSMHAKRGPLACLVEASGNEEALWVLAGWLRYGLRVTSPRGTLCWWGFLNELELELAGLSVGLSLNEMRNKIAIRYSYDAPGGQRSGITAYDEDDLSVLTYGIRERIENASDTTYTAAISLRTTMLDWLGLPLGTPADGAGAAGPPLARLYGRGEIETLGWRYYANPLGRVVHDEGGSEQVLGYGFTSELGFKSGANSIHEITGKLGGLPAGARIQISGLSANNGAFTVAEGSDDAAFIYIATTISFAPSDDIFDSTSGLGFVRNHEMIHVSGSTNNDGYHYTDSAAAGTVTTDTAWGGTINSESAGASVTLRQGNSIVVEETVAMALPGATATVVGHGMKVAQSFTLPTAGSWTVGEILVRLRKVGSPADSVTVSLRTDNAGAPNYPPIESITIAASGIAASMDDITFAFANTATLTSGATYWIVIERTGANEHANYYVTDVDENAGYSDGTLLLWTGAAWVARSPDASLSFSVWGHQATTTQIGTLVTAVGQFGLGVTVRNASGISTRQYRAGTYDGLTEFDKLLDIGTNAGKRLLARLAPGTRTIIVEAEPTPDVSNDLIRRRVGQYYWPSGAPLESGVLPVGRWVTLAGVPVGVSQIARISPVFVEEAEYDVASGRVAITPRGALSPWDIGKVRNG